MSEKRGHINRRRALENGVWDVDLCHVVAGGSEVEDYLVIRPKGIRSDLVGGVAILPERDGYLGLQLAYRVALESSFWEIPRGFVEKGETAEEAASRELEEETGLLCSPARLERLATVALEPSTIAAYVVIFLASDCEGDLRQGKEFGVGGLRFYNQEELETAVKDGRVVDATTMIAAQSYIRRNRERCADND